MDKELKSYLEKYKIEYKEYRHPPVFSFVEARKLKKKIPGMHCKTLFLKDSRGKFYLVGMRGDKRLDTKILRKKFEVKKLNFASEEELKRGLEVYPGAVSIFAAIRNEKIVLIIDEEVWLAESSGFHPNENTSTFVLDKENLRKFYDSLICEKHVLKI
ncbi:prolyl-tRNA synthetase associated domain-containing protein [Candidatus Pacearchaeota archaeon]|nr:prolyl-tRNA synthetase associated domain-containing protein [Candidatus Pacearchaeota archaeon]